MFQVVPPQQYMLTFLPMEGSLALYLGMLEVLLISKFYVPIQK